MADSSHNIIKTFFIIDKAFIVVLFQYFEYTNIFFFIFITKLLKYIRINNHLINLDNG